MLLLRFVKLPKFELLPFYSEISLQKSKTAYLPFKMAISGFLLFITFWRIV